MIEIKKEERSKVKMRKMFRIDFIIFLLLLISENSFAESKLVKIKDNLQNK